MKLAALLLLWCLPCHAADQASWYGEQHRGLPMAHGKGFNPDKLTAASWFYDLGTRVVVTHAKRSVIVEITDRGPARRLVNQGRKIDLSRAAFARLGEGGADTKQLPNIVPAGSKAGRIGQCAPLTVVIGQGLLAGLSAQRLYQDLIADHGFIG